MILDALGCAISKLSRPARRLWNPSVRRGVLGLGMGKQCKCCGCIDGQCACVCNVFENSHGPCYWRLKLMGVSSIPCGCCWCEELNGRELLFQPIVAIDDGTPICSWSALPCPGGQEPETHVYWACATPAAPVLSATRVPAGEDYEYFLTVNMAAGDGQGTIVWRKQLDERPSREVDLVGTQIPLLSIANPWQALCALTTIGQPFGCRSNKCDYSAAYWEVVEVIYNQAHEEDPPQQLLCGDSVCPSCDSRTEPSEAQCVRLEHLCPPRSTEWRRDHPTPSEVIVTLPTGWSMYAQYINQCFTVEEPPPDQMPICSQLDGATVALEYLGSPADPFHSSWCDWAYTFPEITTNCKTDECSGGSPPTSTVNWRAGLLLTLRNSPTPGMYRITLRLTIAFRQNPGGIVMTTMFSLGQAVVWQKDVAPNACGLMDQSDFLGSVPYFQTSWSGSGSTGFLLPDCNFGQNDVLYFLNDACARFDADIPDCPNGGNLCGCAPECGGARMELGIGEPTLLEALGPPPYTAAPAVITALVA